MTITKSLRSLSVFCVINLLYSFAVSYFFTVNLEDFLEIFMIMNFVFYLQLTAFPIGVWHEKRFVLCRKTGDPEARKLSIKSSLILMAVTFTLMTAGIFIACFTTPKHYGPLLQILKMMSVMIAIFGLLVSGLLLHRELERGLVKNEGRLKYSDRIGMKPIEKSLLIIGGGGVIRVLDKIFLTNELNYLHGTKTRKRGS